MLAAKGAYVVMHSALSEVDRIFGHDFTDELLHLPDGRDRGVVDQAFKTDIDLANWLQKEYKAKPLLANPKNQKGGKGGAKGGKAASGLGSGKAASGLGSRASAGEGKGGKGEGSRDRDRSRGGSRRRSGNPDADRERPPASWRGSWERQAGAASSSASGHGSHAAQSGWDDGDDDSWGQWGSSSASASGHGSTSVAVEEIHTWIGFWGDKWGSQRSGRWEWRASTGWYELP